MLHANFKDKKYDTVMANAGRWSDVKYITVQRDCLIKALIPQSLLIDNLIPKIVVTLISIPCWENKIKLKVRYGVTVSYEYSESTANSIELKEAV